MVRNAYRIATPEKNRRFPLRKSNEKMKKCLNRVEKKGREAAIIRFCRILKDKSIGDKLRSQNLVSKIISKGSAGQKKS